jgi:hypothetical protein
MRTAPIVFGIALLTAGSQCIAAAPTPLAGVWRFERELDRRGDGSLVAAGPALGYEGLLVLTPDGFMSVTIMPRGRKWTVDSASLAELRETTETGTAYSGPYTVESATQTLAIDVSTSLDPEDVGKRLTRHYSLNGDVLTLSGTWRYQGETLMFAIDFRRIR